MGNPGDKYVFSFRWGFPVVTVDDHYVTFENTPLDVTTLGTLSNDHGLEGGQPCVVLVTAPIHGVLDLRCNGSFTYTADDKFNREDTFEYAMTDGAVESQPATVTITVATAYPWHNGIEPLNVSAEGGITPIDALMVINELNSEHKTDLPTDRPRPLTAPFLDVNRDGQVTPFDALLVINYLNSGEGEGEHLGGQRSSGDGMVASCRHGGTGADGRLLERRETVA